LNKLILLIILLIPLLAEQSLAAFKCTDQKGRLSFQDKPCKADEESQIFETKTESIQKPLNKNNNKANAKTSRTSFKLTDKDNFTFLYPKGWKYAIKSIGKEDKSKKITLTSNDNKSSLSFLVSKSTQAITNRKQILQSATAEIRSKQSNTKEIFYEEMGYDFIKNALAALITNTLSSDNSDKPLFITHHIVVSDKYLIRGKLTTDDVLSIDYAKAFAILTSGIIEKPAVKTDRKLNAETSNSGFSLGPQKGLLIRESNRLGQPSHDVTARDSKLILAMPKKHIANKTSKSKSSRFEFSNLDEKELFIVSGWIEPSNKYPGVKEVMQEKVNRWRKGKKPVPQGIAYKKIDQWDTVSYTVRLNNIEQYNIESHFVEHGSWIHLHLSIVSSAPILTKKYKLETLLKSFEVLQKY